MSDPVSILCVSDGRRGIENQALGLMEAMGRLRDVESYNHTLDAGAVFKAATPTLQFALKSDPSAYGLPDRPFDIVIGCGRQAIAPLMAYKSANLRSFTAYIQDPRIDPKAFDVVIAPTHDRMSGDNVISMIGSPNRITDIKIIGETLNFAPGMAALPMPRAAFLIGGDSKTHKMDEASVKAHLDAARVMSDRDYSLLITLSRRTPEAARAAWHKFAQETPDVWLHDDDGPNPYFAFLGGADHIFVTEDSTNMITEACATGKPVYRLLMTGAPGKFAQLYEALDARSGLRIWNGLLQSDTPEPLRETDRVAGRVWARFDKRRRL